MIHSEPLTRAAVPAPAQSFEAWLIRLSPLFGAAALPVLGFWVYLVLQAPLEATMGLVYKILYVHVPCVFPTYVGFLVAGIGGVGFLRTRHPRWDRLALAGAEVGVLFCSAMIASGMLWAWPVWGVPWVWDARLTSTAVMWFIYLAYLFVRAFATGSDSARSAAAVHAAAGVIAIPFVYYAIQIGGEGLHPTREPMPPEFRTPLLWGFGAAALVFFFLLGQRLQVARLEAQALGDELD